VIGTIRSFSFCPSAGSIPAVPGRERSSGRLSSLAASLGAAPEGPVHGAARDSYKKSAGLELASTKREHRPVLEVYYFVGISPIPALWSCKVNLSGKVKGVFCLMNTLVYDNRN